MAQFIRLNLEGGIFTKEWGRAQVFVWAYIQAYLSVEKKTFLENDSAGEVLSLPLPGYVFQGL